MKFSIILPTRERPKSLKLAIDSIITQANNKENFEIHLGIDDDDISIIPMIKELKKIYSDYNIFEHVRVRSNSLVDSYINWMGANFCKGDYLFILNDDCIVKTKNWDVVAYNALENFLKNKKDRIVCGMPEDLIDPHGHKNSWEFTFSCFPIISKEATKALGFVLDPAYLHSHSDYDICELYSTVGRGVDLRKLLIVQNQPPEIKAINENIVKIPKSQYKCWIPKGMSPSGQVADQRIVKLVNYITQFYNEKI